MIFKKHLQGWRSLITKDKQLFLKNGPTRPLFRLFSVFFKQTSIQFYNKLMWKNVHPVYGTGIRTHDL